jgi:hypothetical protein
MGPVFPQPVYSTTIIVCKYFLRQIFRITRRQGDTPRKRDPGAKDSPFAAVWVVSGSATKKLDSFIIS